MVKQPEVHLSWSDHRLEVVFQDAGVREIGPVVFLERGSQGLQTLMVLVQPPVLMLRRLILTGSMPLYDFRCSHVLHVPDQQIREEPAKSIRKSKPWL